MKSNKSNHIMNQSKPLLIKALMQRKNMWISSFLCEFFLPAILLFILFIIKLNIKDEIFYSDNYDKIPVNYGPVCFACNLQEKDFIDRLAEFQNIMNHINLDYTNFPLLFRICQILNNSVIGLIGDFSSNSTLKFIFEMALAQKFQKINADNKTLFKLGIKEFPNQKEFDNYLNDDNYKKENIPSDMKNGICFGIELTLSNNIFNLILRFDDDSDRKDFFNQSKIVLKPSTQKSKNILENKKDSLLSYSKFTEGSFFYIQSFITDTIIISQIAPKTDLYISVLYLSPLHRNEVISEHVFLKKAKSILQIIIGVGFSWSFFRIILLIGVEKKTKLIGMMIIKGLNIKVYWVSMAIEFVIVAIIISLPCILLTKLLLLNNSNWIFIISFYFIHCLNEFAFAIFCSAFLNSSTSNIIFGGSIYFLTMLTGIMLNSYDFSYSKVAGSSMIPPIGGVSFISILTDYEIDFINNTLTDVQSSEYIYQLVVLIIIQIMSFLVFFTLGILANHFLTNSIGLPKYFSGANYSLTFFEKPKNEEEHKSIEQKENPKNDEEHKSIEQKSILLEMEIPKMILHNKKANEIQNAIRPDQNQVEEKKNDSSDKNIDIDEQFKMDSILYNFNSNRNNSDSESKIIDLYEGDVIALIGENGSGKTTFLNLISNFINPRNRNLSEESTKNLRAIHQNIKHLGFCSNENIFCSYLTVEENIKFFLSLTEFSAARKNDKTKELIDNFCLQKFTNDYPEDLPLGYKRALAIALAFVGDYHHPPLILMDNPTIGMDWSLKEKILHAILNRKSNATIIFASQFMEEAEFLGNKFVYLHKGKFLFYKELSLFKQKLHSEYVLTIEKKFAIYKNDCIIENDEENKNNDNDNKDKNKSILSNDKCATKIKFIPSEPKFSSNNNTLDINKVLPEFIKKKFEDIKSINDKKDSSNRQERLQLIRETQINVKFTLTLDDLKLVNRENYTFFMHLRKFLYEEFKLNLFSLSKQTLDDIFRQIYNNFIERSNHYSNNSHSNKNNETQNMDSNNENMNQNDQKTEENKCRRFLSKTVAKYSGLIKKRFLYLIRVLLNDSLILILGVFFTLLCLIILCLLTISINFQYSSPIPQVIYDYSNFSNPFYIDIADPKYNQENETKLTNIYDRYTTLLSRISNFNYIQVPPLNSFDLNERMMKFYSFIYSQKHNSLDYTIGSMQIRNLYTCINKFYYYTIINNIINLTSSYSIGIHTSLLLDSLMKFVLNNTFGIQFTNYPQPVSSFTIRMMKIKIALIPITFFIFSLIIIEFIIILPLLNEIASRRDFVQKLYAGRMSFWISNFIFDFIESFIIIVLFLLLFVYPFQFIISNIWPMTILYSISIIPYNYFCMLVWKQFSFMHITEKYFLFINILVGILLAPFIQALTRFDELLFALDIIEKIFQFIFPVFALHQGLFYSLMKQSMEFYPENVSYDVVNSKIMFAYIALGSSFTLYLLLIFALELYIQFSNSQFIKKLINNNNAATLNPIKHREIEGINLRLPNNDRENAMQTEFRYLETQNQLINNRIIILEKPGSVNFSFFNKIVQSLLFNWSLFVQIFFPNSINNSQYVNFQGVGYSGEYSSEIPYLTIKENLEYYLSLKGEYSHNVCMEKAKALIKEMKLIPWQDQLAQSLNDGTKKLLKLAISLISETSFVFIDDLSSELDPNNKYLIWDLICSGKTYNETPVIFNSLNLEEPLIFSTNFRFIDTSKSEEIIKYDYEPLYCCEYLIPLPSDLDKCNYRNPNEKDLQDLSPAELKVKITKELCAFKLTDEEKDSIIYELNKGYEPNENEIHNEENLKTLYIKLLIALVLEKKRVQDISNEFNTVFYLNSIKVKSDKLLFCALFIISVNDGINQIIFREMLKYVLLNSMILN